MSVEIEKLATIVMGSKLHTVMERSMNQHQSLYFQDPESKPDQSHHPIFSTIVQNAILCQISIRIELLS